MKTQLLVISGAVLALSACGQGAKIGGGKQGASEAFLSASQATKGGADKAGQKAVTGEVTVNCAGGGTATLKGFAVVIGSGGILDVGQSFDAVYNGCAVNTEGGLASMNGTLSVVQTVKVGAGAVDIDQSMKGKLTWMGAIDDFLDMDIVQKVQAAALTKTSGGVGMFLKGTLTDSEGTFTFDESITVTAGKITLSATNTKK